MYADEVLAESTLKAYWKCIGTAGSTAADSSGAGLDMTIHSSGVGLNVTPGVLASGPSFSLDGVAGHARRVLPASFKLASVALEAWIVMSDPVHSAALGYVLALMPGGSYSSGKGIIVDYLGASDVFSVLKGTNDGSYNRLSSVTAHNTPGELLHIVGWYKGDAGMRLYVNNVLEAINGDSDGDGGPINWADLPAGPDGGMAYIGAGRDTTPGTEGNVQFFKLACIGHCAVYASAQNVDPLPAARIAAHYEAGLTDFLHELEIAGTLPGLVGSMTMEATPPVHELAIAGILPALVGSMAIGFVPPAGGGGPASIGDITNITGIS